MRAEPPGRGPTPRRAGQGLMGWISCSSQGKEDRGGIRQRSSQSEHGDKSNSAPSKDWPPRQRGRGRPEADDSSSGRPAAGSTAMPGTDVVGTHEGDSLVSRTRTSGVRKLSQRDAREKRGSSVGARSAVDCKLTRGGGRRR